MVLTAMVVKPDIQFFKDLSYDWMNAWKQRNHNQLDRLLAEDFSYIIKTKKSLRMDKVEWLRMALELYQLLDFQIDFITVTVHDHTAVVVYRIVMNARPNYTGEPEQYFMTDVWSSHNGQWQAISRQPMPL